MAIGFVLLWNSGFIGAEYGLPYSGPFTLLFWRYAALTLVLAVPMIVARRLGGVRPRALLESALIGALAHGVWLGCVLVSLDRGVPAGIVALVVALQPLTTGALSGPTTGEGTSPLQWAGLVLGFAGVVLAVTARIQAPGAAALYAYLLPFGSVAAITIASLVQRRRALDPNAAPLSLDSQLFAQAAATAIVVGWPAIAVEGLETEWTIQYAATLVWLIGAVSFGAYVLMWALLSRLDAVRVASLFYLGPPTTMAMAWLAFGDTLTPTDLLGLLVGGAGVGLALQGRDRSRRRGGRRPQTGRPRPP